MREFNGWALPNNCGYFDKFLAGLPPKKNGFQREHLEEALKHVKTFDYAVDVGAHVGFWAKDMADLFKKVYCFEPAPENFACLAKNLAGYNNVELLSVAVGDKPRMCSIARDDERAQNSGSEYVRLKGGGEIRMINIDSLELPGCDFLKVDVEGFELAVLRGAKATLAKYHPVICMESDKKFSRKRFGWENQDTIHFLYVRDYHEVAHMRPDRVFVHRDQSI